MPSMLKADQDVMVLGDKMDYDGTTAKSTYGGTARLFQGEYIDQRRHAGHRQQGGQPQRGGQRDLHDHPRHQRQKGHKERAEAVDRDREGSEYDDSERRLIYTGDAHMNGPEGDMTAARIELFLTPSGDGWSAPRRTRTSRCASRNRETKGAKLIITTSDEIYVITGTPVKIVDQWPARNRRQDVDFNKGQPIISSSTATRRSARKRRAETGNVPDECRPFARLTSRNPTADGQVVRGVNPRRRIGGDCRPPWTERRGQNHHVYMTVGLTPPDSGRVELDGQDVRRIRCTSAHGRASGICRRSHSIFRGLTVEQNLLAILETMPLDPAARRTRLRELLAELKPDAAGQAPAHTLSGGERRRTEITRALVISPKFILLDEPSPASIRSPSPTSRRSSFTSRRAASAC